ADIGQLAYLLGIVIVIIPAVPALAAYLPFRVGRFREIRAVSKALGASEDLGQLERHLAGRALVNLSFHQLARISSQPLRDFEEGRVSRLAHAELARLGLDPSLLSPAGRVSEQDKS
ncbi:MAG: hypothetical protein ACRD0E_11950, partial [Acidimicrobiales bacterium]